ncbi:protein kinase domain-containing protein [uncultured Cellulomonas sp.]|uniref:protein kinase domain-containing protein n=1 Tax=uncultured Cellulomonas sp. TaxID=189682 RepID=UPI0026264DCB|nr:hypothetical protein [uncultured Cellulomonas sp.]
MDADVVPAELAAALLAAGYRVGGPAGVGGGGPVWTATAAADRRPGGRGDGPAGAAGQRYVVHVVPAPLEPDGGALAARLAALWSLDHPHLARVVDVLDVPAPPTGGSARWAVLVAEVPGATVAALLAARGRLTAGEVVTLLVPVAGALDALHRAGLVHGDVSPANVVVRPDGRPVLIDLLGDPGRADDGGAPVRGTPGFMAPEVVRGGPAGRAVVGSVRDRATHHRPDDPADDPVSSADRDRPELPDGAPADVFSLASVGLAALDLGAVGSRLGHELAAACAPDPVLRPTAAEVASACYPCARPEPIALPDAGVLARTALAQLAADHRTVSAPGRSRHRARPRRRGGRPRGRRAGGRLRGRVAAVPVLAALAVVTGALLVTGPGPRDLVTSRPAGAVAVEPPASATGAPSPGPPGDEQRAGAPAPDPGRDPVTAAVELTRRRAEVLAGGDPAALTGVSRPGSGAHRADLALMADLRTAGVRLEGLAAVVEGAALTTPASSVADTAPGDDEASRADVAPGTDSTEGSAQVSVRAGLTAHRRVTDDGTVEVPAQPPREVVLRLVRTEQGWRVEDVVGG